MMTNLPMIVKTLHDMIVKTSYMMSTMSMIVKTSYMMSMIVKTSYMMSTFS